MSGTKKIRIRRAQAADINPIYKLLCECYDNAIPEWPKLDHKMLLKWVCTTVIDGEVWVADLSGRVIGTIGLAVQTLQWSPEPMLIGEWIYVLSSFRKQGAGKMLLLAVCQSADEQGLRCGIGTYSGGDADWRDEFMQSIDAGMRYGGGMFLRNPQSKQPEDIGEV